MVNFSTVKSFEQWWEEYCNLNYGAASFQAIAKDAWEASMKTAEVLIISTCASLKEAENEWAKERQIEKEEMLKIKRG